MAKKYSRHPRTLEFFAANARPLPSSATPYYPTAPGYEIKTVAGFGPSVRCKLLGEIPLSGFSIQNELLLYRVLKDLFGEPDYLSCFLKSTGPHSASAVPHFQDWGFMFAGPHGTYVEVQRTIRSSVPRLLIWVPRLKSVRELNRPDLGEFAQEFLSDLELHLTRNKNLFIEKEERSKASGKAIPNVYGEMITAGVHLLDHGRTLDKQRKLRPVRVGEAIGIAPNGTFFWHRVVTS